MADICADEEDQLHVGVSAVVEFLGPRSDDVAVALRAWRAQIHGAADVENPPVVSVGHLSGATAVQGLAKVGAYVTRRVKDRLTPEMRQRCRSLDLQPFAPT